MVASLQMDWYKIVDRKFERNITKKKRTVMVCFLLPTIYAQFLKQQGL